MGLDSEEVLGNLLGVQLPLKCILLKSPLVWICTKRDQKSFLLQHAHGSGLSWASMSDGRWRDCVHCDSLVNALIEFGGHRCTLCFEDHLKDGSGKPQRALRNQVFQTLADRGADGWMHYRIYRGHDFKSSCTNQGSSRNELRF